MKYVLIKYKHIKLLVAEGCSMDPPLNLLPEIEQLVEKVNNIYGNLINATREEGVTLEAQRRLLTTKLATSLLVCPL